MVQARPIYKSAAGRDEIMALYEAVLSKWPVPAQQFHLSTRHGDTFVIASGDDAAPAIVLLHGSGSNSATWAHDVIAYSRQYRVYAVDIPGEPGKSAAIRFSCHGPAFAEWLDEVMDGLGLQKAILGGISLGGWAALNYAVHRPERVVGAILICPAGVCPPRLSFALIALPLSLLGEWGLNRMKRLIFRGAAVSEDADRFFTLVGRHFNYRTETPPIFTDEELRRVSMPVLFLAGEQDVMLQSRKTAERLERLLPNVTAHVFPADGHAVINMASAAIGFLNDRVRVA